MVPSLYLDASTWQKLPGDVFFARYEGEEFETSELSPAAAYRPVSRVPAEVFVRTSEREKRLEFELKAGLLASGPWGSLFDVSGAGSQVGLILTPAPEVFIGAHVLPDIVHMLGNDDSIAYDATIKDVHIAKTVRIFSIGSEPSLPHDLVLTTKYRWFRNRANPKHLGFSKEEK